MSGIFKDLSQRGKRFKLVKKKSKVCLTLIEYFFGLIIPHLRQDKKIETKKKFRLFGIFKHK